MPTPEEIKDLIAQDRDRTQAMRLEEALASNTEVLACLRELESSPEPDERAYAVELMKTPVTAGEALQAVGEGNQDLLPQALPALAICKILQIDLKDLLQEAVAPMAEAARSPNATWESLGDSILRWMVESGKFNTVVTELASELIAEGKG